MNINVLLGVMIPFFGTAAGAACVFFLKDEIKPAIQKSLLGFASGVMVAASVWSLLIPAMETRVPTVTKRAPLFPRIIPIASATGVEVPDRFSPSVPIQINCIRK